MPALSSVLQLLPRLVQLVGQAIDRCPRVGHLVLVRVEQRLGFGPLGLGLGVLGFGLLGTGP
jgi:hypothetical protein